MLKPSAEKGLDETKQREGLRRADGFVAAVLLAVVLLVGIQLGGVPWRFRKQLWQLQGAVLGAVVGYVVGRWSGASTEKD